MDEALKTVISRIGDVWEECAGLVDGTEDYEDFEVRLSELSTALIRGALRLRLRVQDSEEARNDLATDMFHEVFSTLTSEDRASYQGEAHFHGEASMNQDGVAPCRDWVVQYAAIPR